MRQLKIEKVPVVEVSELRQEFLNENKIQFIHNKCHAYGWADIYVFTKNETHIGYGSVWGKDHRQDRDTIFEFYLRPEFRKSSSSIFDELVSTSQASFVECQTNDPLLAAMMFTHASDIHAQSVLFEDDIETHLEVTGVEFKKQAYATDHPDDRGGYVLERHGEVMATGGFMLNYNYPFADIYMEVKEPYRHRGLGSLMVQELKKEIYNAGHVPAARCNVKNMISRATLLKAGFRVCGYWLTGKVKTL